MSTKSASAGLWESYLMALDQVTDRLHRIVGALEQASALLTEGGR